MGEPLPVSYRKSTPGPRDGSSPHGAEWTRQVLFAPWRGELTMTWKDARSVSQTQWTSQLQAAFCCGLRASSLYCVSLCLSILTDGYVVKELANTTTSIEFDPSHPHSTSLVIKHPY